MASRDMICPQMADVWGGDECWSEQAEPADRWRCVLASGCNEGNEIREIWECIQQEAHSASEWLGEEVPEILLTLVEGIGDGSVTGGTRGKIVEALENTRAKVNLINC